MVYPLSDGTHIADSDGTIRRQGAFVQQLASYRTADGQVKVVEWDQGRFLVDGFEVSLSDVLSWDAAGALGWVSAETQAWARSLGPQPMQPQPAHQQPAPQPAAQPEPQPEQPQPVPAAGSRLALLADMLVMFGRYPGYTAQYGTDTDIVIDNKIAQASWGTGKKKVDYAARMKAVEPERTLYFFEMLKEQSSGLSFGGLESESYSTFGTKRSGKKREAVLGPDGVAMDYEWDYGQTRAIVESVCASHGWTVRVVLKSRAASY